MKYLRLDCWTGRSHAVMGDLRLLFLLSMGVWFLVVLVFVSIARSMG